MLPLEPERDFDFDEYRKRNPMSAGQRAYMNRERKQTEGNLRRLRARNALIGYYFGHRSDPLLSSVYTAPATLA